MKDFRNSFQLKNGTSILFNYVEPQFSFLILIIKIAKISRCLGIIWVFRLVNIQILELELYIIMQLFRQLIPIATL